MREISAEDAVTLRGLDEQERLAWQQYAATHNPKDLQTIEQITTKKDEIYGLEKRAEEL